MKRILALLFFLGCFPALAQVCPTCGSTITVQQAGSTIVNAATTLNFASGATVTQNGNVANVNISGGGGGVTSFNTRTGTVTLLNTDISSALGFTPLSPTGSGAGLTGITYSQLPALSANQILGSLTATTPSGQSVPSCSAAGDALLWTSGTGFGCATGYAPLASPTFTGTLSVPQIVLPQSTAVDSSISAGGSATGLDLFPSAAALAGGSEFIRITNDSGITGNGTLNLDAKTVNLWQFNGNVNFGISISGNLNFSANSGIKNTSPTTFNNSDILLLGSSTGATTLTSANTTASNFTLTLPAITDTVTTNTAPQTLTNKTLTSPSVSGTLTVGTSFSASPTQVIVNPTSLFNVNVPINTTTSTALTASTGTVVSGSTANDFSVTGLTATTNLVVNFPAYTRAPYCTGNGTGLAPIVATTTTTSATFVITALTGTFVGGCQG